jgi:hypothetical protein
MPNRAASLGDTVTFRTVAGDTQNVEVTAVQATTPPNSGFSLTPAGAGGTLATATYSYRLSVIVAGLESAASTAKTAAVTGPTGQVTVDATVMLAAYPTATHWRVYGRTAAGPELLMTQIARAQATFVDTGALTPAGAPKAAGGVSIRNPSTHVLTSQVPMATARTDVEAYFNRQQ